MTHLEIMLIALPRNTIKIRQTDAAILKSYETDTARRFQQYTISTGEVPCGDTAPLSQIVHIAMPQYAKIFFDRDDFDVNLDLAMLWGTTVPSMKTILSNHILPTRS